MCDVKCPVAQKFQQKDFIDFAREVGDGWGTGMGGGGGGGQGQGGGRGSLNSQRDGKRLAHRCVR